MKRSVELRSEQLVFKDIDLVPEITRTNTYPLCATQSTRLNATLKEKKVRMGLKDT